MRGVVGSLGRQEPVEVPDPVAVAGVAGSEARSWTEIDLRAAGTLDDLGGGGEGLVVEVAAEDHRVGLATAETFAGCVAVAAQDDVKGSSAGHRLGGAAVEGVARVAQTLTFVVGG